MLEQIARDRASQLRRPRQARVSMRRAGEPRRWRCPCLGTSDGSRFADLPGWRPRPSTFGVGCGLDEANAFLLQYRLSQPALDTPENTDARASRRSPRDP